MNNEGSWKEALFACARVLDYSLSRGTEDNRKVSQDSQYRDRACDLSSPDYEILPGDIR